MQPALTLYQGKGLSELMYKLCRDIFTFQFELVLELFVNLIFVKLGICSLKVKVFFKLHRAIPAHVHFASAAVTSSSTTAIRLSSS